MSTQFCRYCDKVLSKEKGEVEHGCLDCHMDIRADKIYHLEKENQKLQSKVDKLKRLLLLTDDSVSNITIGKTQVTQWGEFCSCFPEEGEE